MGRTAAGHRAARNPAPVVSHRVRPAGRRPEPGRYRRVARHRLRGRSAARAHAARSRRRRPAVSRPIPRADRPAVPDHHRVIAHPRCAVRTAARRERADNPQSGAASRIRRVVPAGPDRRGARVVHSPPRRSRRARSARPWHSEPSVRARPAARHRALPVPGRGPVRGIAARQVGELPRRDRHPARATAAVTETARAVKVRRPRRNRRGASCAE